MADEFIERAGKDGVSLLAKTPKGQHALAMVFDYVSEEAAELLRQAHTDQRAIAVNYTRSEERNSVGNFGVNFI